jgi:DNA recombination protein RmuC
LEPLIIIVAVIVALLIGLALGWVAGGRTGRAGLETTAQLRAMLDSVVTERDSAKDRLARLETSLEERERSFDEQMRGLSEAKDALSAQFGEIGQKLLEDAQTKFLQRASERFSESEATAGQKLSALLQPVHDRLEKYESAVSKVEAERREAFGNLHGLMESMRISNEAVKAETQRLGNSLRNAPKSRGRWGEQQLKNVLESCGLSEHVDFVTEASVSTEDGRLRPDAIIKIPGGRSLVIDAKVSLNDYQDAFNAIDDLPRDAAMARHTASMRAHIDGLSRKAYWDQFEEAPDYVIMFVPGEHFLAAALEHQPDLWDFAFEKRVLLATPTNLVAIARTVASVWRQEGLAREAKQIGALGKELYDRIAVAAQHLKSVGSGLTSAVNNYNKFVGSFERNVMSTGRRFAELNIETGQRQLDEIGVVEALPRYGEADSPRLPDKAANE